MVEGGNIKMEGIKVICESKALLKMLTLVMTSPVEIAWFGYTRREDDGYYIEDVTVHPQRVTGVSVTVDELKRAKWMISIPDDKRGNLHFHGHSHVSFGVNPSTVDMKWQKDIEEILPDDGFYVFVIINKKFDIRIDIYDKKKNIICSSEDEEIYFDTPDGDIHTILSEMKENVRFDDREDDEDEFE